MEKTVLPAPPIKIKVPSTLSKLINFGFSKEWLKAVELELKSIKVNEVTVLTPVLDIPINKKSSRYKMGLGENLTDGFRQDSFLSVGSKNMVLIAEAHLHRSADLITSDYF